MSIEVLKKLKIGLPFHFVVVCLCLGLLSSELRGTNYLKWCYETIANLSGFGKYGIRNFDPFQRDSKQYRLVDIPDRVAALDGEALHKKLGKALKAIKELPQEKGGVTLYFRERSLHVSGTFDSRDVNKNVEAAFAVLREAEAVVKDEAIQIAEKMYPNKTVDREETRVIAFWNEKGRKPSVDFHEHSDNEVIINFQTYPGAKGLRVRSPSGKIKILTGKKAMVFGGRVEHASGAGQNGLSFGVFIEFKE